MCHNQQIAISYNDAEWVSQAYRPSAVLDFKMKFLMGSAIEGHVHHRAG